MIFNSFSRKFTPVNLTLNKKGEEAQPYIQILILFSLCQEWETETVVLEVGGEDELGVELAGGRDDPICPGENPIYVSSINKVEYL